MEFLVFGRIPTGDFEQMPLKTEYYLCRNCGKLELFLAEEQDVAARGNQCKSCKHSYFNNKL